MAGPDSSLPRPLPDSSSRHSSRSTLAAMVLPVLTLAALSLLAGYLASPRPAPASGHYEVGEFTTAAIRAPYDVSVVDEEATRLRREQASLAIPAIALVDSRVPEVVTARIREAFGEPQAVLAEAARLGEVAAPELNGLSEARRRELRRQRAEAAEEHLREHLDQAIAGFEHAIGGPLTQAERDLLVQERFGERLISAAASLVDHVYREPVAPDRDPAWADTRGSAGQGDLSQPAVTMLTLRDARTGAEGVILDASAIRRVSAVRAGLVTRGPALSVDLEEALWPLVARIVGSQLAPNAVVDEAATNARRRAAAEAVIPVSLNFRRNQLIIGEGQEVTRTTELVLAHLEAQGRPRAYTARFLGAVGLVCLLLIVALRVARAHWTSRDPGRAMRDTLYIACSLAIAWVSFWFWLIGVDAIGARSPDLPRIVFVLMFPFAALPMHTRFMIGFDVARIQLIVLSIVLGMLSELGLLLTAFVFITGLLGAHLAGGCRRRGSILRAGFWTGAGGAAAAIPVALLAAGDWANVPWGVAAAGMAGGLVSGAVVVAASRVSEWLFGYTTPVRLLEMLSYEQPLLRDLATRAPGTFQHSVAVAGLADAAAQAVGADALLVRAGALYHDVGKLARPEFFSENQSAGNPHDGLSARDSAAIIQAHVAEGVSRVKGSRLGEPIAAFVREHHGRSTVSYFLDLARQRGEPADEEAFRYPGPSPGSRETAILMIADRVEATSRSMPGASEPELREMVGRTIDRLRLDGEFDRAPLTLGDLNGIAGALVLALGGARHQRVAYPPAASGSH